MMESSVKKYVVHPVKSYLKATVGEPVKQVTLSLKEEEKARPRATLKNQKSLIKVIRTQAVSPDIKYTVKEVRPSSSGISLKRDFF